jgi:hypothetical protein
MNRKSDVYRLQLGRALPLVLSLASIGLKMELVLTRRKELRRAPSVAALPQRGVESLFPTDVIDGPEDLRFVSSCET